MPSREVGNLAVAAAFALFAFFCSTRTVWCENFFELLPIGGGRPANAASEILAHFTGVDGDMNDNNNEGGAGGAGGDGDDNRAAADTVAQEKAGKEEEKKKDKKKKKKAASEPTIQEKEKEASPKASKKEKSKTKKVRTPLSPEVEDPDTGLVLPRVKRFSSDEDLVCLGVGARVKKIAFVHVNVYTVVRRKCRSLLSGAGVQVEQTQPLSLPWSYGTKGLEFLSCTYVTGSAAL